MPAVRTGSLGLVLLVVSALGCRRDEPPQEAAPPHYGHYPNPAPGPAPGPSPAGDPGEPTGRAPAGRPSNLEEAHLTALLDECFAPASCSAIACATLSDLYFQGTEGVPRDRIRARELMIRSCRTCGGASTALGQQTCRAAGVR
jgi:hypothetical protein